MNAAHASALLINLRRQSGWLLALVVAIVGCSTRPADQPEIAAVSGRVTLDGQPLGGVSVVFESDRGVLSFGNTDDEGRYTVSYIRSAKGAGLGRNVVRIRTPMMGPASPLRKDRIPSIYNTASTLAVDVAKGSNVFDFTLESKPSGK
jgi:hypothetical protein